MARHHTDPVLTPGGPLGVFPGVLRTLEVPTPAPAADWAFTVPSDGAIRIRSITALLTTSATVANRVPGLTLSDPDRVAFAASSNAQVPAATVQRITYMPGMGAGGLVGVGGVLLVPLLDMVTPVGYRLASLTGALSAGDQYSGVRIVVEEMDSDPDGYPFGRRDEYDNRYGAAQAAPGGIR